MVCALTFTISVIVPHQHLWIYFIPFGSYMVICSINVPQLNNDPVGAAIENTIGGYYTALNSLIHTFLHIFICRIYS